MKAIVKLVLWLAVVLFAIFSIKWINEQYTLEQIQQVIIDNQWSVLAVYAAVISVRGVLFIPTMPFILLMASVVDPLLVFLVTLGASCLSSYIVCLAVDHFDIQKRLATLPNRSIKRAQDWINSMGVAAVVGWSFFPLVFTELIVYFARIAGLRKRQLIVAVAIGEGMLIALLTYATQWATGLIQY